MKNIRISILCLLFSLFLTSCIIVDNKEEEKFIISGKGTIHYVDLEGGFYGLVADGGEQFRPVNLSPRLQKDNLRVYYRAELLRSENSMGIQMWGRRVRLVDVEPLDNGHNGNGGNNKMITIHGTVRYVDLEGGFYGIITDDGNRYRPLNLERRFAQDGLRVTARVKVLQDDFSIQMWGESVEVVSMSEDY